MSRGSFARGCIAIVRKSMCGVFAERRRLAFKITDSLNITMFSVTKNIYSSQ